MTDYEQELEIKKRQIKALKQALKDKIILPFFKERDGQCFGAVKVDNHFGWFDSKDKKSWPTHDLLSEMVKEGVLEKCSPGEGFKYKKAS